jgi:hypothetical protein
LQGCVWLEGQSGSHSHSVAWAMWQMRPQLLLPSKAEQPLNFCSQIITILTARFYSGSAKRLKSARHCQLLPNLHSSLFCAETNCGSHFLSRIAHSTRSCLGSTANHFTSHCPFRAFRLPLPHTTHSLQPQRRHCDQFASPIYHPPLSSLLKVFPLSLLFHATYSH